MLDAAKDLEFEKAAEPHDHHHQLVKRWSARRCWWESEAVGLLNRLRAPQGFYRPGIRQQIEVAVAL